jgi:hypothetical protein
MVLNHGEKQGGRDINNNHAALFQEVLNDCNLQDLGYHGDMFTWANNQETTHHIKERLDRFCASTPWLSSFPRVTNYHLPNHTSDHNPILLVFGSYFDSRNDSKNSTTIKKFEHIWLQDAQSFDIIKEEWSNSRDNTTTKLQKAFSKVYQWGQDTYGNVPRQIKELQQQIHNMKAKVPNNNDLEQISHMETNLDNLLKHEETWWAQRAKANWLQQGDRNTSFFHYKASQRKRKNKINFVLNQQGIKMTDNKDIQGAFMDYFTNIFTSSNPINISDALAGVANRVNSQMQDYLNQDFSADEVSLAVHQLKGNSAPGPDGLSAKFFQTYWDIIGGDITNYALNILNHGGDPDPINDTYICLIPKNKQPSTPADFRPIALCNVMLKIITKTISNRIKPILNSIISPHQSAFLPGRLITDNTLIAYETFHYLKHSKAKKMVMLVSNWIWPKHTIELSGPSLRKPLLPWDSLISLLTPSWHVFLLSLFLPLLMAIPPLALDPTEVLGRVILYPLTYSFCVLMFYLALSLSFSKTTKLKALPLPPMLLTLHTYFLLMIASYSAWLKQKKPPISWPFLRNMKEYLASKSTLTNQL